MGFKLPRLISDGMILQQKKKVHIWGWDEPGRDVIVSFLGEEYVTVTDEEGCFSLYLGEYMPGGPYSMHIWDNTGEEKIIDDIMVGDVFICAGQSNMELPMERVKDKYPEEIKNCTNPAIRTFKITEHTNYHGPLSNHLTGEWKLAQDSTILSFSATAYFFAEQIYRMTKVPVGLINASLGGSRIESWMGRDMLAGYDDFLALADKYADDAFVEGQLKQNQKIANDWHGNLDKNDIGLKENWISEDVPTDDWEEIDIPFFFKDTKLSGFIGSVWFRRKFTVSDKLAGKRARVWLGTIVDSDSVYVNGKWIGQTDYQYPPRKYTVPEGLLREGENTIVIRVKCENGQGRFTPGKEYALWNEEERVSLAGKWKYRIGAACEQIGENDFVNWKPTGLYNGMMAPCHPYTIAGILWYQGEANSWNPDNYFDLTRRMVEGYRAKWQDDSLPYIYVQLPNFCSDIYDIARDGKGGQWAQFREVQRSIQAIEGTRMVVAIDLGEDNDLHPVGKKDVGFRLAMQVASMLYGLEVECSGPQIREVKSQCTNKEQGEYVITLVCEECTGGMYAFSREKGKFVDDIEVIDETGNSYRVKVTLEENKIILNCGGILEKPLAVRYCYSNTNKGALIYNRAGFPMSPFVIRL